MVVLEGLPELRGLQVTGALDVIVAVQVSIHVTAAVIPAEM
jgi:hypothetical protein